MAYINMLFLVDIEEVDIEGFIEKRPALGEDIRDWVIIAREPAPGTRAVVHIIISDEKPNVLDRLRNHPVFLGEGIKVNDAYRMVWDNHSVIAKHIIQCTWVEYDAELDQDVLKRASIIDWEIAGSPTRVENYIIPHVWAGV